jgi:hypothetical protein
MPRRARKTKEAQSNVGEERAAVFSKTKMCKFFILGQCTKGHECCFAHDNVELQLPPDLQRTKLCKTLINTGVCKDPNCSYAHNKVELRVVPGFNTNLHLKLAASQNANQLLEKAQNKQEGQQQACKISAAAFPAPSLGFAAGQGGLPAQVMQMRPQASGGGEQDVKNAMDAARLQQLGSDLLAQATMIQMGQAAQAHAAEAIRLQAMASYLKANMVPMAVVPAPGTATTLPMQNSGAGYVVGAGQQQQQQPQQQQLYHGQAMVGQAINGSAQDFGDSMSLERHMCSNTHQQPGYAEVHSGGNGDDRVWQQQQRQRPAGRKKSKELSQGPVPEYWAKTYDEKDAKVAAGLPLQDITKQVVGGGDVAGGGVGGLVVKNTFLTTSSCDNLAATAARLRPVSTCQGNLQSYVDEQDQAELEKSISGTPEGKLQVPGLGVTGKKLSFASVCTLDSLPEEAAAEAAAGPAPKMFEDTRAQERAALFAGLNAAGKVQIKNTFIELNSDERPSGSLRSVHTCSGRLDLMALHEE